jgi:hypothetical protein
MHDHLIAHSVRPSDWRDIAIALIDTDFSEQKAQTCEKACFRQLTNFQDVGMPPERAMMTSIHKMPNGTI